jgi:hypothetical protein
LKSRKIPLPPPFPKGEKVESFTADLPNAPLPLKKGGREGFMERPFQNAKVLQFFSFSKAKAILLAFVGIMG